MDSSAGVRTKVRFGRFELNLKTGELRHDEIAISLQPQPTRILTLLAGRPGELVTREEIREKIWGTETFIDFDTGLNNAIRQIRQALQDNNGTRLIETVPRRGYRFIAPELLPVEQEANGLARDWPKLGPYVIQAQLAAGGMGEVYRARDTRLDRTVAIKVLPTQLSSDSKLRQRLEREARAISSLNHPNIGHLYDVGHQDEIDYLVMEYLEGETLANRLLKGPVPLDQVLKIGAELAGALDHAHRHGIVHRDVKPGNVMLTKTGAKLMDFGLAKPATAVVAPGSDDITLSVSDLTRAEDTLWK